ncbi:MAG: PEGA domain-containing protein [Methanoregula sp.]|jgi:hypothetical protein|uniref:PEGA domain-containing protein n=1 Tax=Methanoregula sp. TaxID=2052170 RepID=UPI003D0D840A
MKKTCMQLIFLAMVALILSPFSVTGQSTTNSTVVPITSGASAESSPATQGTPNTTATNQSTPAITATTQGILNMTATTEVNITQTIPVTTTLLPAPTTELVPATTPVTPVPTASPITQASVGNITVASSPLGASILIDAVYYGTTPGNITGIPAGNHIIRLTLSGYYDYEGTFSALPGQVTNVFGTLPPLTGSYIQPSATPGTPAPVTTTVPAATVQPTQTSSGGVLENPSVIAAIIGIITAGIGAGATIFTHISKTKKE